MWDLNTYKLNECLSRIIIRMRILKSALVLLTVGFANCMKMKLSDREPDFQTNDIMNKLAQQKSMAQSLSMLESKGQLKE